MVQRKEKSPFLHLLPLYEVVVDYCLWSSYIPTQILGNKNCLESPISLYGDHHGSPWHPITMGVLVTWSM